MKKILVTGAGGFVGARVLQQWAGLTSCAPFLKAFWQQQGRQLRQSIAAAAGCHSAHGGHFGYRLLRTAPGGSLPCQCGAAGLAGARSRASGAKLVAFSSDQVYAGVSSPARCRRHCPCSLPMYMAAANWKWNSACWSSARTLYCCGPPGCTTCRATGCPSGATCR